MLTVKDGMLLSTEDGITEEVASADVAFHLDESMSGDIPLRELIGLCITYPLLGAIFPRHRHFGDVFEIQKTNEQTADDDPLTHFEVYQEVSVSTYEWDADFEDGRLIKHPIPQRKKLNHVVGMTGVGKSGTGYSCSLDSYDLLLDVPVKTTGRNSVETASYLMEGIEGETLIEEDSFSPSLYELLRIVIDDLTFYGGEEQKNNVIEKLKESLNEIEAGDISSPDKNIEISI